MTPVKDFNSFSIAINESSKCTTCMCDKLWSQSKDGSWKLDPVVERKLLRIAQNFWNQLAPSIGEKEISDVHISGDLADYNHSGSPDIDLHILIDLSGLDPEEIEKIKREIDLAKFQMNLDRPPRLRGYDVDLHLNDIETPHDSTGLYSLMKGKWICQPGQNESLDDRDCEKKYYSLGDAIEKIAIKLAAPSCTNEARKKLLEKAGRIKKKIQKMRSVHMDEARKPCVAKNAYQKLKKEGYIDKLVRILR